MESLELRIFREVAYANSISKAAENMGYVQSNITAHIKKLENELNTTLFIRHNKGITLTQNGEKLLIQAEKIITLLDNTVQAFNDTPKTLKIGTTQTIAGYLLPQCMVEYQKRFPDIAISLHTLSPDELNTQMAAGIIDCIITNGSYGVPHAKRIFQRKEELMLITPDSCLSAEDIDGFPIITNNIASCPYREILLEWWHLHHSGLLQIMELDTVEAILNTVAAGGGISLLPKTVLVNRQDINCHYIKEMQSSSISMWVKRGETAPEYFAFQDIITEQLHT